MAKPEFAEQAKKVSTDLAQLSERVLSMFHAYFDRGYNGGGSDPLLDSDIVASGVTAAQIAAFITLAEQLGNFLNNQSALVSDYDSTINKLRTDI